MLLVVDVGNTNVHLGLWRNTSWQPSWRARTVPDKMPDEYAVLVRNFLSSADLGYRDITGVIISSVVPTLTRTFVELVRRYMEIEPLVVTMFRFGSCPSRAFGWSFLTSSRPVAL